MILPPLPPVPCPFPAPPLAPMNPCPITVSAFMDIPPPLPPPLFDADPDFASAKMEPVENTYWVNTN